MTRPSPTDYRGLSGPHTGTLYGYHDSRQGAFFLIKTDDDPPRHVCARRALVGPL